MKLTLVGVNFRPREAKDIVTELEPGDNVLLRREPSNAYDSNAIKVLVDIGKGGDGPNEVHIGYVAKEEAVILAPMLDEQSPGDIFEATVYAKTGAWKAILSYDE